MGGRLDRVAFRRVKLDLAMVSAVQDVRVLVVIHALSEGVLIHR